MILKNCLLAVIPLFVFAGCGNSSSSSSTSSTPFTSAIGSISTGVAAAGSGLQTNAFALTDQNYFLAVTPMVAALCDVHGMPLYPAVEGGASLSQSDMRYPFVHTYCAMTVNAGDTVRGGFDTVKGLICALESGGIEFNGVAQNITIDFTNTTCWPSGGPGGATSGTISATGTAPASFNSHFEKGVQFTYVEGSDTLTYKVAANITATNIEFIAHESWSNGNTGVMAGSLNKTTGVLLFEKRDERVRADCATSSCGWNRHTRLAANLTLTSGEPSGLTSLSYGYSDIQISAANVSNTALTTASGKLITATGSITGGVKSRIFSLSNQNIAGMKTPGNWAETAGVGCMTGAGINTANCTSNTGIGAFASTTKFALVAPSPAHLSPSAWLAAFSGFTFTTVDTDVDQAF